ncbi:hypothetical protein BHE74_00049163 [Ensete ventricosum]|nr:hypothetical protein BHE74_00049163 [Ensete ventricosum]
MESSQQQQQQQQRLDDSFSYGWLTSVNPSEPLGDSHRSVDTQDGGGSFIELDPGYISMRWTDDGHDFGFSLPGPHRQAQVHADQIFSDGHLLPLHLRSPSAGEASKSQPTPSCAVLSRAASANSSPLFHSAKSSPYCASSWSPSSSSLASRSGKFHSQLVRSCAKSPKKILCKYFCFMMPLYKMVKDFRLSSWRSVGSYKDSARSSPRTSNALSSIDWCRSNADISIYDAILHCKKSIASSSDTRTLNPVAVIRLLTPSPKHATLMSRCADRRYGESEGEGKEPPTQLLTVSFEAADAESEEKAERQVLDHGVCPQKKTKTALGEIWIVPATAGKVEGGRRGQLGTIQVTWRELKQGNKEIDDAHTVFVLLPGSSFTNMRAASFYSPVILQGLQLSSSRRQIISLRQQRRLELHRHSRGCAASLHAAHEEEDIHEENVQCNEKMEVVVGADKASPARMEWNKLYRHKFFESDSCDMSGLLQIDPLKERPTVGIGLTVRVSLSVPVSVLVVMLHFMDAAEGVRHLLQGNGSSD